LAICFFAITTLTWCKLKEYEKKFQLAEQQFFRNLYLIPKWSHFSQIYATTSVTKELGVQ